MDHKFFSRGVSRERITEGWSADQKYCLTDQQSNKYLLRISDLTTYDVKAFEFERMKELFALEIPIPEPIAFGSCDEGIYSIQTWIESQNLKEVLPLLSIQRQYSLGLEAGAILQRMHTMQPLGKIADWETRYNHKIDRKINQYAACPVKYSKGQLFIDYIQSHRHLLKNRPQCFQHGDFHIGNMLFTGEEQLYIIDFENMGIGDPWEEFNRIVWFVQESPSFAKGMVNGYFSEGIPPLFWKLLALYISSNLLSSLPWSLQFGEEKISVMQNNAQTVLSWYDDMQTSVPNWYV